MQRIPLLMRYLRLFPLVKQELRFWSRQTANLPTPLQTQACLSLKHKQFHCLGGAVYALYPRVDKHTMVRAIVALQTISDYLDNLCDRMNISDPQAFRQLHLAFQEAVEPGLKRSEYYLYYPYQEQVYLPKLVEHCQQQVATIPNYHQSLPFIRELAENYCELQVLKHLAGCGESELKKWIADRFPETLAWNEWAAATGSTLGIFLLMACGFHNYSTELLEQLTLAYFPWVQGVHILLDYLIDREEDSIHGDLNFTFYHQDISHSTKRIYHLYKTAHQEVGKLPHSHFHHLILQGLIAMYGSDPKTKQYCASLFTPFMQHSRGTYPLIYLCDKLRAAGYLA